MPEIREKENNMNDGKLLLSGVDGCDGPPVTAPSGRILYRHRSNMGTVVNIDDDGEKVSMFVADAKYRTVAPWNDGTENRYVIDSDVFNNSQIGVQLKATGATRFDGKVHSSSLTFLTPETSKDITDAQLNTVFYGDYRDAGTSRQNTDILVSQPYRYEAALFCRSIKVGGMACDLARAQLLARVYCDALALDELDPTLESYPAFSLSDWNLGGVCSICWTSTGYNLIRGWTIWNIGTCQSNGSAWKKYGVIPVLEL